MTTTGPLLPTCLYTMLTESLVLKLFSCGFCIASVVKPAVYDLSNVQDVPTACIIAEAP